MSEETKPTPTPWRTSEGLLIRGGPDDEPIADVMLRSQWDAEANAAFIVRAVNSHATLLAACEAARAELAALAEDEGEDRCIGNYDDVIETIDAAIAAAKAGEA